MADEQQMERRTCQARVLCPRAASGACHGHTVEVRGWGVGCVLEVAGMAYSLDSLAVCRFGSEMNLLPGSGKGREDVGQPFCTTAASKQGDGGFWECHPHGPCTLLQVPMQQGNPFFPKPANSSRLARLAQAVAALTWVPRAAIRCFGSLEVTV